MILPIVRTIALLLHLYATPAPAVTPDHWLKGLYTCTDPFAGQSMDEVMIVGGGIQIDLYVKAIIRSYGTLLPATNTRMNLYGENESASQLADKLVAVGNLGEAFLAASLEVSAAAATPDTLAACAMFDDSFPEKRQSSQAENRSSDDALPRFRLAEEAQLFLFPFFPAPEENVFSFQLGYQ